ATVFSLMLLTGPVSTAPVAHAQEYIPDLVCPAVGGRSPAPRPATAADEEIVPFDLDALGDSMEPPSAADPDLVARFRPGVAGVRGPGIRRLAIWGDSHIASGIFGDELRRILGLGGIDTGTAFIPPFMTRRGVRIPVRAFCVGSAWSLSMAYASRVAVPTGPALAEMHVDGNPDGGYLWLDLRDAERAPEALRFRMLYRPMAGEAEIAVSVNEGPEESYFLEAANEYDEPAPKEIFFEDGDLLSTVKIRVVAGQVALQGFLVDKVTEPSLTVDVFGFPGATVNGWAMADPRHLSAALYERGYDAVVLEFGTNEAAGDFDPARYAQTLDRALMNMRRVFPDAACLLVGAPDRGSVIRRKRGSRRGASPSVDQLLRYPRIHSRINAIQAEVGAMFGCSVWDWQRAMGGAGAAYRWARMSPPLMSGDLIHLTPPGYRRSAAALARHLGWGQ
ncbi:MAG: GDSL-type esterase/lipase family protein, partial [Gammaproteobacteria bacterium]